MKIYLATEICDELRSEGCYLDSSGLGLPPSAMLTILPPLIQSLLVRDHVITVSMASMLGTPAAKN